MTQKINGSQTAATERRLESFLVAQSCYKYIANVTETPSWS
jgi:hypothetical protein